MKRIIAIFMLSISAASAVASDYRLTLAWSSNNLYKIAEISRPGNSWYAVTQFCFELPIADAAIISYTPYSFNNRVTFSNGTTCTLQYIRNIVDYQ